ncbi:hypothetical protein J6590_027159 [Homalodisca vitripennis]|nr:hypothetical protein J6590_027159 [Homalodisca vitripennis]
MSYVAIAHAVAAAYSVAMAAGVVPSDQSFVQNRNIGYFLGLPKHSWNLLSEKLSPCQTPGDCKQLQFTLDQLQKSLQHSSGKEKKLDSILRVGPCPKFSSTSGAGSNSIVKSERDSRFRVKLFTNRYGRRSYRPLNQRNNAYPNVAGNRRVNLGGKVGLMGLTVTEGTWCRIKERGCKIMESTLSATPSYANPAKCYLVLKNLHWLAIHERQFMYSASLAETSVERKPLLDASNFYDLLWFLEGRRESNLEPTEMHRLAFGRRLQSVREYFRIFTGPRLRDTLNSSNTGYFQESQRDKMKDGTQNRNKELMAAVRYAPILHFIHGLTLFHASLSPRFFLLRNISRICFIPPSASDGSLYDHILWAIIAKITLAAGRCFCTICFQRKAQHQQCF